MAGIEKQLEIDLSTATFEYRQAEVEVRRIQARQQELKWQIDYLAKLLSRESPFPPPRTPSPAVPSQETSDAPYAGKGSAEVIEDILRKSGKKMRVPDIVEIAISKGFGGPDPDKRKMTVNFASVLARAVQRPDHPVFRRAGRGLFETKPEANDVRS